MDVSPSRWFPLARQRVALPDGQVLDDYYLARLGHVAMVVPVTPRGELVFVRQYKNGVGEITLEFPAGYVEAGQTPEECARAELLQETGIRAENLRFVGELWQSSTKLDTRVFGYLAAGVTVTQAQCLDSTEAIEVVSVPPGEVDGRVIAGEINCSDTLALLGLVRLKFPEAFG